MGFLDSLKKFFGGDTGKEGENTQTQAGQTSEQASGESESVAQEQPAEEAQTAETGTETENKEG